MLARPRAREIVTCIDCEGNLAVAYVTDATHAPLGGSILAETEFITNNFSSPLLTLHRAENNGIAWIHGYGHDEATLNALRAAFALTRP